MVNGFPIPLFTLIKGVLIMEASEALEASGASALMFKSTLAASASVILYCITKTPTTPVSPSLQYIGLYSCLKDSLVEAIHRTGLMTEEYKPKIVALQTVHNIIKILILFWLSCTLLAIYDAFFPIYPPPPPPTTKYSFKISRDFPPFFYPTLCGWYAVDVCW